MPDPIDYPWAVVTILSDDLGFTVIECPSLENALRQVAEDRRNGWTPHLVPLPDLLAWVRANAREGRT